jgi:hypothetical protein
MRIVTRCRSCGVPQGVSRNHKWRDNGTIVFARDPSHRMVLLESDNLDGIFEALEALVERPIEKQIIEGKAKATRDFLKFLVKGKSGRLAYVMSYVPVRNFIADLSKVMGYGRVELREVSPRFRRAERMTLRVRDIYSLPLVCGDFKGASEAVEGGISQVDYLLEKDGSYQITSYRVSYDAPPEEGFPIHYADKPGEIGWERCPSCGVPREVGALTWDLERGIINDPATGRRMALFGPMGIELVFMELEQELGRPVDDLLIEAQRRHALTFLKSEEVMEGLGKPRKILGMRGLGYLEDLEAGREEARLRIANPCLTPLLIGFLEAAFEAALERKPRTSWETEPDGDLLLKMT